MNEIIYAYETNGKGWSADENSGGKKYIAFEKYAAGCGVVEAIRRLCADRSVTDAQLVDALDEIAAEAEAQADALREGMAGRE